MTSEQLRWLFWVLVGIALLEIAIIVWQAAT
jgi:hypothetical protein